MEHCIIIFGMGVTLFLTLLGWWVGIESIHFITCLLANLQRRETQVASFHAAVRFVLFWTHTHTVYIFWFCYTLCVLLFAHTCTHTPVMCCLCTRKPIHIGTHACWNAFVMEPSTCRKLQEYQTAYQSLKGLRTLEWKPHLGTVDVDLVLADRELSFSVSPIRATIIYQFQQQSEPCLFDIHWI